MKKGLVLAVAMLLLSSMVFAGGFYISADASFSLPMKGWESSDIFTRSFADSALEKKMFGGLLGEIGAGYEFGDVFRLGIKGGAGFNQTVAGPNMLTVPLALDMNVRLFSLGPVEFRTALLLGGYGRIYNKTLYFGPYAGMELGTDVRLTEHFAFGIYARVNTLLDLYNSFKGMGIELDFIPMAMTMKYVF